MLLPLPMVRRTRVAALPSELPSSLATSPSSSIANSSLACLAYRRDLSALMHTISLIVSPCPYRPPAPQPHSVLTSDVYDLANSNLWACIKPVSFASAMASACPSGDSTRANVCPVLYLSYLAIIHHQTESRNASGRQWEDSPHLLTCIGLQWGTERRNTALPLEPYPQLRECDRRRQVPRNPLSSTGS
ncbi:hypothetical protein BKA70DRAFT_884396 [Coprinopsis sp. MPI-PUGE-AT-0042]|nr:hypothetical protein BKA70DRAFT_884396 [Coprinopsis sp. MPI-PUGE-AT-0042]